MAVLDLFIALILSYQALTKRTKGNTFNFIMHLLCMFCCPFPTTEVEITNKIIVSDSQVQVVFIKEVAVGE